MDRLRSVGDGECCVGDTEVRGNLGGPAVEAQVGATAGLPHHLNLQPVHPAADSGAQGLGGRLLGGKSRGQALGSIALAHAVGLLRGVNTRSRNRCPKRSNDCWMRAISTRSMPLPTIMLCTNLTSGGEGFVQKEGWTTNQGDVVDPFGKPDCPTIEHHESSLCPLADIAGMRQASTFRDIAPAGCDSMGFADEGDLKGRAEPGCEIAYRRDSGLRGLGAEPSASDTGLIDMLFEFERHSCLEIYSILIAAGLELSQSAHVRFTELCQCTRMVRKDCSDEIVSIDLEVQTSPID